MSNQQKFLLALTSLLVIGAVPGLFMTSGSQGSPSATPSSDSEESASSAPASQVIETPSDIPNTQLSLERSTKQAREEIKYARKVNINEAGNDALQTIPNVGPATAESIINYRKQGNVFYEIQDLDKISGIGSRTVEDLKPHITVGKEYMSEQPEEESTTEKIDINSASQSELTKLPGVGSVTAQSIVSYREQNGPFNSLEDLDNVRGIGPSTIEDMRDQAVAY